MKYKYITIITLLLIFSTSSFSNSNIISPANLIAELNAIAPGEDTSWITEDNFPFIYTENGYLSALLIDYVIAKEFNNRGLSSNENALTTSSGLTGYYDLYLDVGEGQKIYYGDAFVHKLAEIGQNATVNLGIKLANYGTNGLGLTQYNLIKNSWGRYEVISSFANAIANSSNPSSLVFIESLWNIAIIVANRIGGVAGGRVAGIAGMYMNFLFSTLNQFKATTIKTRIKMYASMYYQAKALNEISTYYYKDGSGTQQLIASSEMYTYLNQLYLNTLGPDGYEGVVLSYNLTGANNYDLEQSVVQDINLFVGPAFVAFIEKHISMLNSCCGSWSGLKAEYANLIANEISNANIIRNQYLTMPNGALKLSKNPTQNTADVLNTGSERVSQVVYVETTLNDEFSNYQNIESDSLRGFNTVGLQDLQELRFNLFNVEHKISLQESYFEDVIADVYIDTYNPTTFRYTNMYVIANVISSDNATYDWNFGDGTIENDGSTNATHRYLVAGTYTVSVAITKDGNATQYSKQITVAENSSIIPATPVITVADNHYDPGDIIQLTASSTSVDETQPIVYNWYQNSSDPSGSPFATGPTITITTGNNDYEVYYADASNSHGTSNQAELRLFNNAAPAGSRDVVLEPYTIDHGGSTTTISTFYNCGTIYGKLILKGGTLDLQGCTLQIKGDFIQSGGTMDVNGGTLIVEGDYLIQTPAIDANSSPTHSIGRLKMLSDNDKILVMGDFLMDTYSSHSNYLTAGELEVKGNFTQLSTYNSNSDDENFFASGTHRVLLSGTIQQAVSFDDPSILDSHFNILEITNTSTGGVLFSSIFAVQNFITHGNNVNIINIKTGNWVLPNSETINGDMAFLSGTLNLNGVSMTVQGDLKLNSGTINLNGGSLTIEGSFNHSGGTMDVNGGTLIVEGDYLIQTPAIDANSSPTHSIGRLKMLSDNDKILVMGDFLMDTYSSHSNYLTAGELEVKGNFTQLSTYNSNSDDENFFASGTHRVLLSGTIQQTVSFDNPVRTDSHFNILEITNTSPEGVIFLTNVVVTTLFNHHNNNFIFQDGSTMPDYDGDGTNDNEDTSPTGVGYYVVTTPESGLVTDEAGNSDSFNVRLESAPTDDVVIDFSSSDTSEGTVNPSQVTFTTDNWNVEQTITITGVDDNLGDGNVSYQIIIAPPVSNDENYNNINPADLDVINNDDDNADLGITLDNNLDVIPAGEFIQYEIVVTNNGPKDVTNAVVEMVLPTQLSNAIWNCNGTSNTSCTASGSNAIIDMVDIPSGGSVTYILDAQAQIMNAIVDFSVIVTPPSNIYDPILGNNISSDVDYIGETIFDSGFEGL